MEINVDKVCRLCSRDSMNLEPIFGFEFETVPIVNILIKVCHQLRFPPHENDDFPGSLCSDCIEVLCQAHKLNEVSIKSEEMFSQLLHGRSESFVKIEKIDYVDSKMKTEPADPAADDLDYPVIEALYEAKSEASVEDIEVDNECEESSDEKESKKKAKRVATKKHQCPTCLKFFEKPSKLNRHLQTHDVNKKPYACEFAGCFQRFLTDASLKRHAILHSGMTVKVQEERTHQCIVCSKEFPLQEALASHMRKHKDDKIEYPCSLCDQVFKKLNDLTRHSRKHPENKSHKCLICSKMFSQGSHLIDHLNRHNNLRPFSCHVCNKSFQQSSTLKDHLRTHTLEKVRRFHHGYNFHHNVSFKPFLCSECGKSFNNPSNLRQHVKRHLNLKEFACHLCPGKFSCKGLML